MTTWKRAVVTGASSGIGMEFARQLAADGSDLVLVARREKTLTELAKALDSQHNIDTEVLAADLTEPEALERVSKRVRARRKPVDLVVNNAGYATSGTFSELKIANEDNQIRLNVLAVVHLTHAALPRLQEAGHGGILNVSSIVAYTAGVGLATYSATKSFVTTFTQAVHEEMIGTGVHVSALTPGVTRTEFQDVANLSYDALPQYAAQDAPEVVKAGLDGVNENRAIVHPGLLNSMSATLLRHTPQPILRRMGRSIADRLQD